MTAEQAEKNYTIWNLQSIVALRIKTATHTKIKIKSNNNKNIISRGTGKNACAFCVREVYGKA